MQRDQSDYSDGSMLQTKKLNASTLFFANVIAKMIFLESGIILTISLEFLLHLAIPLDSRTHTRTHEMLQVSYRNVCVVELVFVYIQLN